MMKNERKFDNKYLDLYDNQAELTQDELNWFYDIVSKFQQLPEASGIQILNRNHDELAKRDREAYGIFYQPLSGSSSDCFITIDNYFIHEMYGVTFYNDFNLAFETLEGCIAHEIAHKYQFRHCKRHTRIAAEILEKYNNLKKQERS